MNVISLFSGCGGLDLGFKKAGFNVVIANEFDKKIWDTYKINHPETRLIEGDIRGVNKEDILKIIGDIEIDGIIGGPPCQSWSEAGALRGINDDRGKLFYEYIRILKEFNPKFFVCENVKGMLSKRHKKAVEDILGKFGELGYKVSVNLVNASDYGVGQDRERVFYVGVKDNIGGEFRIKKYCGEKKVLRDIIWDLQWDAVESNGNKHNENCKNNNEYHVGGYSSIWMSRNRRRGWDECGFTVQASGRQCQLHPNSPEMVRDGMGGWKFIEGKVSEYRRMTVRECARLQGFGDDFKFIYKNVDDGYKMIGNAVPVELGKVVGESIIEMFEKNG